MLKIVSLGTSNAISAIEHSIKHWGKKENLSLHRIFKYPVSKLLSEEDVVKVGEVVDDLKMNLVDDPEYLKDGILGSVLELK